MCYSAIAGLEEINSDLDAQVCPSLYYSYCSLCSGLDAAM